MQHLGRRAESQLGQALSNMVEALKILDEAGAPGHIGAHLDLAIEQLRHHISPQSDAQVPRIGLGDSIN